MKKIFILIASLTVFVGCETQTELNNKYCSGRAGCYPPIPEACTTEYYFGMEITLKDTDGNIIPNGSVKITDGSYEEYLMMGFLADGTYVGAGERAGTYDLEISAPGFQNKSISAVEVTRDWCHVNTAELTIALER